MPGIIKTVTDEEENDYPELANFLNLCHECSRKVLEITEIAEIGLTNVNAAGIIDHIHAKCYGIHVPICID